MKTILISLTVIILIILNLKHGANAQKFDSFTDIRDSITYTTIRIGSQVWMAESLRYNDTTGSYCYDNDPENCRDYGRLYTWETAKNVCPQGWRLANRTEWRILLNVYGGEGKIAYKHLTPGGNSDFNAYLGGYLHMRGLFSDKEKGAYFWTSTEKDYKLAWQCDLRKEYNTASMTGLNKNHFFSVRCIKNE